MNNSVDSLTILFFEAEDLCKKTFSDIANSFYHEGSSALTKEFLAKVDLTLTPEQAWNQSEDPVMMLQYVYICRGQVIAQNLYKALAQEFAFPYTPPVKMQDFEMYDYYIPESHRGLQPALVEWLKSKAPGHFSKEKYVECVYRVLLLR